MAILGLVLGPHSFWGWVLEVGIGGFAVLVVSWLVSLAVGFYETEQIFRASREYHQASQRIDQLYRQEENLLDLAADATLDTGKVRTRLTRLQAQRKEIHKRLANNDDRLAQGAVVLEAQLDLLQHPQELYRQLSDHGLRLVNQATFEELLIDQDLDDLTIQVVGQTYTEPVRDLMLAAHAYREQPDAEATVNANRPAMNGEPVRETLAGLLSPIYLGGGWSKTAMVDLLGYYSNQTNWAKQVHQALSSRRRVTETTTRRGTAQRLGPEKVAALARDYQQGATVYELAERYKIHRQTVSEHLYRQGVRMRGQGLDGHQVDDAALLYEQGWSVARIGRKLDVDGGTVWLALRARGVRMRDTHGREK